jgi:hypothetical protein
MVAQWLRYCATNRKVAGSILQTALIWILAHLVYYRIQTHRRLSLRDFVDFLKRARWKAHFRKGQIPNTGRYLEQL